MELWESIAPQVAAIASILAFLASLFLPYRALIKSKDAEIQVLQQRMVDYKEKIQELNEAAPDKLVAHLKTRVEVIYGEMKALEAEKINIQSKYNSSESDEGKQSLREELARLESIVVAYEADRAALSENLQKIEEPYFKFFQHYGGEMTPGRRFLIGEVVRYLGADTILACFPMQIVDMFRDFHKKMLNGELPEGLMFNGGAMSGLNSAGLVTEHGELTHVGVAMLQKVAKELSGHK